MEFFAWLETTGLATWIKESESIFAYDIFGIGLHAIGMGMVVGLSSAVALRILGFAPSLPLGPMEKFFPFMWAGFWINAASGVWLFTAYPVKAVTNPGFYVKLAAIALALVYVSKIRRQVFGNSAVLGTKPVPTNGKILAGTLLFVWLVAVVSGRLMAYHGVAGVEWQTPIGVVIVTAMIVLGSMAALGKHPPADEQQARLRQGV
jgi:hypothetical protein